MLRLLFLKLFLAPSSTLIAGIKEHNSEQLHQLYSMLGARWRILGGDERHRDRIHNEM